MPPKLEVETLPVAPRSARGSESGVSLRLGDSWARGRSFELIASGLAMEVSSSSFAPSVVIPAQNATAEIDLLVSKGASIGVRTADGREHPRGGTSMQVARIRGPGDAVPVQLRSLDETPTELVSITMTEARLCELLGSEALPSALHEVTRDPDDYAVATRPLSARLLRLLDEVLYADIRGPARLSWHEAKSIELVALITDELHESTSADAPSTADIERVEAARARLSLRLEEPPTLDQLAAEVGLSATRLKGGFRAVFGVPLYTYLRNARLEEAHRLLLERRLSVTEISLRVGYANPSKFAAAFRRRFGRPPSSVA